MSQQVLVAITFEDVETAEEVRKRLKEVERMEALSLEDAAVVVKDEEGKVHIHGETDRSVKIGAVGGGIGITTMMGHTTMQDRLIGAAIIGGAGVAVGIMVGEITSGERWEEVPLNRMRVSVAPTRRGLGVRASIAF